MIVTFLLLMAKPTFQPKLVMLVALHHEFFYLPHELRLGLCLLFALFQAKQNIEPLFRKLFDR